MGNCWRAGTRGGDNQTSASQRPSVETRNFTTHPMTQAELDALAKLQRFMQSTAHLLEMGETVENLEEMVRLLPEGEKIAQIVRSLAGGAKK